MSNRIKVEWEGPNGYGELVARVPARDYHEVDGSYTFHAVPRPHYCDRGSWLVIVEPHDVDLDGQEGWPRYYFNTERMKAEIGDWVNKRDACILAAKHSKQNERTTTTA